MAAKVNLSKPHRALEVGVVLLGGITEVLDVAPIEYIYGVSSQFVNTWPDGFISPEQKLQAIDINMHWVTETGSPGRMTSGLSIPATDSYASCPPLDIVLYGAVISGYDPTETELAFARKCFEDCSAFITVCGGVEVPLLAGILKGKKATGPRRILNDYRKRAPDTEWMEKRWVRDGKLWTSGTLTNGLDLMHAFTWEYWGQEKDSIIRMLAQTGSWPNRDVDYKDEPVF